MYTKTVYMTSFILLLGLTCCVFATDADVEIAAVTSQKPILDGIIDDVWSLSTKQLINITKEGAELDSPADCSGSWRALWDWEYLYVLVDVNDETLIQDSPDNEGWHDDRVEVFIDGDNSKDTTTDSVNDYQYNFRWNNAEVETPVEWYLSPDSLEGVLYAIAETDSGYLVEIALPWSTMLGGSPVPGQLIGIEVMIDDDDDGDSRDTQVSWYIDTLDSPHNPSIWGTALLGSTDNAGNPYPADGQIDVPRDVILNWVEGKYASTHDIYFGTDVNDVNEASRDNPMDVLVSQNQEDMTYDPPGLLDYSQTYYWRIDEVNNIEPNSPWKGDIWSFTVLNHIVVEDFEDYNDYEPYTIYFAWVDGFQNPANGSTSGYPQPIFSQGEHFVETEVVHGGLQAMPYFYDNTAAPMSEAKKNLTSVTNWTQDGVVTLRLWHIAGQENNAPELMYVTLNDRVTVTNDDTSAALATEWTEWVIDLQEFANQGVNLNNVSSITIGFGDGPPGGSGMVFFDDIRLYRP